MTTTIRQPVTPPRRWSWTRPAALAIMLICAAPAGAGAEVRIAGDAASLHVATNRDTIADVLSALGAAFKLRYRTEVPLGAAAGPAYSGSLRQVIARLLDGYNYLVKVDGGATEITVLGSRGQAAVPPVPAAKPATPADVVSRWR